MAVLAAPRLFASILFSGALLALSGPALADAKKSDTRARLLETSVIVVPRACAGAVVGSTVHVLTAAHCIPAGTERVDVRLRSGKVVDSRVEYLDVERDLALLHLDQPVPVQPLELALDLPPPGEKLSFLGRFDRAPRKPQRAAVVKIGRCPSLPAIDDAVFTSLNAKPGDSGAPVVDRRLRVVAVVHGGAACHIAAPVHSLAQKLAADPDAELEPAPEPALANYTWGPLHLERTASGFRLRWSFRFGSE